MHQPWLYFLPSIWYVCREFIDAVDYILRLSLNIHWRFQGIQWLCFRCQFLNQQWHSIFDNSMRRPWLYFCYRFDASVVNSLTLSITYNGCHSIFMDDFKVYSVLTGNLWISRDVAFLTIPCVGHDSIFALDLMCRSWIHWRWRCYTSAVTQYSLTISRSKVTLFSLTIYGSVVTKRFLQFHASAMTLFFAIDLMRLSWIQWRCRLHTSAVTQYSLKISRYTVTLFSLPIFGSTVT
jgi:hypothetical protein